MKARIHINVSKNGYIVTIGDNEDEPYLFLSIDAISRWLKQSITEKDGTIEITAGGQIAQVLGSGLKPVPEV